MRKTVISCAITGNLTKPESNPNLPWSPREIATASLEAANAGASIVHIHVREPDTGEPSMRLELYAEAVELIRQRNTELIINLTTGPGGRYQPSPDNPAVAGPRTNFLLPSKRMEHIVALKPDVCTLDLNTMVFGGEVVINTPENLEVMAEIAYDSGVTPELELFDSGDIQLALDLLGKGVIRAPAMINIVLGVKYGFPSTPETLSFAKSMLPPNSFWGAFGIGKQAFPTLAQSFLMGGHVRIGMEDTTYLARGVPTSGNAELVEKGRWIVEKLGGEIATSGETREMLGISNTRSP